MDKVSSGDIPLEIREWSMLSKKYLNVSLYEYLWYFVIYAFMGWILEETYILMAFGVFVKRGFLHSPIGPIYGFGMLIVIMALSPIKERFIPLFTGAVLLTSALEYSSGFVLQYLFNQRWWDYTGTSFNLNGYISLKSSLAWGLICVLIVRTIHPRIKNFVVKITHKRGNRFLIATYGIIAIDLLATLATLLLNSKIP